MKKVCMLTASLLCASFVFAADTFEMRGKIGLFGRSQFWRKTTGEDAYSLKG